MDFDDDPVREEHDIYLSKELAEQLYLLQFPLRPQDRPYPEPTSAKYKSENDILRLDYTLPKDEHYDAHAPDKQSIPSISLQSTRNPAKATYAIGVTHNGSIYLTPIKSTLVMRPDIHYFDKTEEPVDDMDEEEMEGEEIKPKGKGKKGLQELRIEYTKRRTDENHFGPLSYTEVAAARNEEPWVDKEVFGRDHFSSYSKRDALTQCPSEQVESKASSEQFEKAMMAEAEHEYGDSAVDPEWKILSSPNYPGRVDAKEWKEKRELRHK